jgi:hypothetical protein
MWKNSVMMVLKKLLVLLAISLVFLGIEAGIALLISYRSDNTLQDIMTMEGILVAAVGIFASMKGASSGASIGGIGSKHSDMGAFNNLQHVRLEREGDSYRKNFFKTSVVEFGLFRVALIISGLLMVLSSWIFF